MIMVRVQTSLSLCVILGQVEKFAGWPSDYCTRMSSRQNFQQYALFVSKWKPDVVTEN